MLRPTIVNCSAVTYGLFASAQREKKERALTRVEKVKITARTKHIAAGVLIIASLFAFSDRLFQPKYITKSENARFNEWVKYYSKRDGYTVEYHSFDAFKSDSDVLALRQSNRLADDVQKMRQLMGFVTVYFDWESDVIFFSGQGRDSAAVLLLQRLLVSVSPLTPGRYGRSTWIKS